MSTVIALKVPAKGAKSYKLNIIELTNIQPRSIDQIKPGILHVEGNAC
jgi:hypothetical protein